MVEWRKPTSPGHTMQLFFIRHAQSTNNAQWLATRSSIGRIEDPMLSDLGSKQAQALANYVEETDRAYSARSTAGYPVQPFNLTHVYCSLMVRSVATAYPLAEVSGVIPQALMDLFEFGGIYLKDPETGEDKGLSGRPRSFFAHEFPRLILPDEVGEDGWWNRPRETESEFYARAKRVWQFILGRHGTTDDHVALVSHGDFYQGFMQEILGTTGFWFGMKNCGITRLDVQNGNIGLIYANRVDYLGDLLV